MKKAVKMLIAASAVAAVFGVGAVSYALWTAGGSSTATAEGPTGMINTVGDVSVTVEKGGSGSSTTKDIVMDSLLPIDNNDVTGTKYWQFTVSLTGSVGDVFVKLEGTMDCDAKVAQLYYKVGDTAPTAASPGTRLPETIDTSNITLNNGSATVYVCMVAYSASAMNKDISLTFTANAS
ncbi:MAG: hypothetical protein J1F71_00475 [Clostridiales bacterium]|nr:hypothetical protein [Clostridiales bacterium]